MQKNSLVKFYLNKQLFQAKRINTNENLSKIRQRLGLHLPEKAFFIFSDGTEIEKEDELNIKLKEVLEMNNSYLITKDAINNDNNSLSKSLQYNKEALNKNNKLLDVPYWLQSHNEKQNLIIDVKENENNSFEKDYDLKSNNFHFNKKDFKYIPSPVPYSNPTTINNTAQKQKDENDTNTSSKEYNKYIGRKLPQISSSKKIEKIGDLDIYLYPSFKFHNFEELKALSFMVVGETGCGKTTLLNSFVNVLLGVKIEDNYRYKIIVENTNKSQAKSQTDQVRIYNIRSVGSYPPVKIIDTPGFGDTDGIETDNKIINQIQNFFKENLNTIT